MLSVTLQSLEALKEGNSTNLAGLEMYIEELTTTGIELKMLHTLGPSYFKNSIQQHYLTTLIQNLTARFEDKSIITAFESCQYAFGSY